MSSSADAALKDSREGSLRFQTLRVQRFNDLTHGLEVELCDDVTVVYGSNASGKTTLAHALRALLWPDQIGDQLPIVEGEFTLDGATWRVELEGQSCTYLKEQSPERPPTLPPSSHGPRYHLYLHDLLMRDDSDFAQRILQAAQGGIDIESAAADLGFEVPRRRKSKTARTVEALRSDVREAKAEQEALREDENRLDALREKRAEAQAAAERAAALGQAIEVAHARTALEEAEATLASFKDVLGEVRGDEVERMEALQEQLQTAEQEIEQAETKKQEAQSTIEESRLPADGLPDGQFEELRAATATLQEQERNSRDLRSQLEKAAREEEAAWDRLAAAVDRETAAAIDLPQVQTIEAHVQAVQEVEGRREALRMAEELFAGSPPNPSAETLQEGLHQLHRWLQAPPNSQSAEKHGVGSVVLLVTGVLVASGGGLLLAIAPGPSRWLGAVLLFLGLLVDVVEWRRRSESPVQVQGRRSLHEEEFGRLGLDPPPAWDREAVERRADQLLGDLREAAVDAEKQDAWRRLRPQREELDAKAEELEAERERLASEVGLDPDVSSRSLAWLLDRLSQWQTAYDEREGTRVALEEAEQAAEASRERLDALVRPYGLGPIGDASEAQAALDVLQSARDTVREAKHTREHAENTIASAVADREEAEGELSTLYHRLDLEEGAEEELRSLIDRHEDYETAVEAERTARTTLDAERRQLHRCEGYEAWMEEATAADLEQEREAARAEAVEEETYLDEIKTIERDIEAAQEEGTVEQLRAEYRRARTQLADDRGRDYDRAVGKVIADLVQEGTRDRGLPPVFHRARDLFADITNDRYELTLDRKPGTFRAYDHVYDDSFALDALSSGTKVQLLLSVRVAFVDVQEQGCQVPLVLDETLANSDAERARAIIDAVQTICQSGRQVLYLTAQTDEVQKWNAALKGEETIDYEIVPLTPLNGRDRPGTGDGAAVPVRNAPENLPAPEETTHQALRDRLDVPPWGPRQPVNRLHLWYLIEAPRPLLTLITAGTRTWGQLHFQHQRGGLGSVRQVEEEFARIQARAQAVASWQEAWRVGRGLPVDRSALERTDAVTDTFIDGVSEIAEELDGDAEALLRIIRDRRDERVSGFRSAKADDLEAYFREHGYLDPRDRHSQEEMWQYVLADLSTAREKNFVSLDELERLFDRLQGDTPSR